MGHHHDCSLTNHSRHLETLTTGQPVLSHLHQKDLEVLLGSTPFNVHFEQDEVVFSQQKIPLATLPLPLAPTSSDSDYGKF